MRVGGLRVLGAVVAAVTAAGLAVAPSAGAQALQIVTDYPAVVVEAGKSAELTLQVVAPTRRRADLAVVESPPGWQTTLRGGNFVIRGVFAGPLRLPDHRPPDVQVQVQVPADAEPGSYRVVVRASGQGATAQLPLTLQVGDVAAGAVTLTAEFPSLRGKPDQSFSFKTTLRNNTPRSLTFSLSADGPPGWGLNARPQNEPQAGTVTVEGGSEQNVDLEVNPPDNTPAGEYPVRLVARADDAVAESSFTLEVTGDVSLELSTPAERRDIRARTGRATTIPLVVQNRGTAPLRGVTFTSQVPTGWTVELDPERIDAVPPGGTGRGTARVTPSRRTGTGDFAVTLTAQSEGAVASADFRVNVQPSRLRALLPVLVVALLVLLAWGLRRRWFAGREASAN